MCFPYADHCNALMTYRELCFGSQPYHQISVHSTIIPSPIAGTAKATAKPHFELKFEYRPQHVQQCENQVHCKPLQDLNPQYDCLLATHATHIYIYHWYEYGLVAWRGSFGHQSVLGPFHWNFVAVLGKTYHRC